MKDDLFKIIGIIIVSFFIIYLVVKGFHLQSKVMEGLTNADGTTTTATSGEAGTAASYAASLKAQTVKLQDELLISKYRKDYEAVIINMDDLVGYMMLKQVLNMDLNGKPKDAVESLNILNTLKSARDNLNATMQFLDKQ